MAAIFGVLVTSATAEMYGEIYWQPITLLLHIQSTNYSAGVRAGTFFAGLGWFMSQLAVRAPQAKGQMLDCIGRFANAPQG